LATVLTTVDAMNGSETLDRHVESVRQAAVADTLILTKTDLAKAADIIALNRRLNDLNPGAPIVPSCDSDADLGLLLKGAGNVASWFKATAEPTELASRGGQESHHPGIRSFSVTVDDPLDWTAFGIWLTMLVNRHGSRILRVKGILSIVDEANPVAVHGVQHLIHPPQHLAAWPDGDRRSRLVFIVDGIDPDQLRRSLAVFMALDVVAHGLRR
jgi:G3E family GTPase